MKIPFFVQEFTQEMEDAAIHALRNESFVGGESVIKFEEEFAKYTGTKYAASVSSGNGALQISLMALEIGESHEVITPTNSFIASANCIRMTNAKPILKDIDMNDGGINLSNIKKNVNAIIPVHIYGNPCNFDSVKSFAEDKKIPIIEDACQAHGAEYKGKKVGSNELPSPTSGIRCVIVSGDSWRRATRRSRSASASASDRAKVKPCRSSATNSDWIKVVRY